MKKKNLSQKIKYTIKFFIISAGMVAVFTIARETKKPVIEIVEKTITIYQVKKVPVSNRDYINCFKSRIEIDAEVRDDWLDVTAGNMCKESKRAFRIKPGVNKWGLVMGLQSGLGLNHSLQPSFYMGFGFTFGLLIW